NSSDIMSYNNEDINSIVSDSLESEIVALNSSLKNNIINSSFETNNESDLYNLPTFAQLGQNLSVDQIEYFLEFQEYPKTSSTGVASVYNVSGWKPDDAKKAFGIANLQYSYGNPRTIRSIKKCPFLGVSICKTYRSCLGVKVCEFSSPELNIEHTFVDFETFLHKTNTQIGKGKIINKGNCPVKFYHIIPDNLTECPFIVMISTGVHNHPPLPPVKTPQNIMENLQKIINNEYDLDLTARKLLTRPMVKVYLQGKPL
ncbi:20751_t:CDS:2, partial [Gigaspora margarita]